MKETSAQKRDRIHKEAADLLLTTRLAYVNAIRACKELGLTVRGEYGQSECAGVHIYRSDKRGRIHDVLFIERQ